MQYGNYYPSYAQQYQQPQQTDSRIWVQGEVGAKAYLVANGNTVVLWDTETPSIYIKTMNNGMPTLQKLNYTISQEKKQDEYVTKQYLDERLKELMNVSKSNTDDATIATVQK